MKTILQLEHKLSETLGYSLDDDYCKQAIESISKFDWDNMLPENFHNVIQTTARNYATKLLEDPKYNSINRELALALVTTKIMANDIFTYEEQTFARKNIENCLEIIKTQLIAKQKIADQYNPEGNIPLVKDMEIIYNLYEGIISLIVDYDFLKSVLKQTAQLQEKFYSIPNIQNIDDNTVDKNQLLHQWLLIQYKFQRTKDRKELHQELEELTETIQLCINNKSKGQAKNIINNLFTEQYSGLIENELIKEFEKQLIEIFNTQLGKKSADIKKRVNDVNMVIEKIKIFIVMAQIDDFLKQNTEQQQQIVDELSEKISNNNLDTNYLTDILLDLLPGNEKPSGNSGVAYITSALQSGYEYVRGTISDDKVQDAVKVAAATVLGRAALQVVPHAVDPQQQQSSWFNMLMKSAIFTSVGYVFYKYIPIANPLKNIISELQDVWSNKKEYSMPHRIIRASGMFLPASITVGLISAFSIVNPWIIVALGILNIPVTNLSNSLFKKLADTAYYLAGKDCSSFFVLTNEQKSILFNGNEENYKEVVDFFKKYCDELSKYKEQAEGVWNFKRVTNVYPNNIKTSVNSLLSAIKEENLRLAISDLKGISLDEFKELLSDLHSNEGMPDFNQGVDRVKTTSINGINEIYRERKEILTEIQAVEDIICKTDHASSSQPEGRDISKELAQPAPPDPPVTFTGNLTRQQEQPQAQDDAVSRVLNNLLSLGK
jgi:hypothetical protein